MSSHPSLLPPNTTQQERAIEAAVARLGDVPSPLRDLWRADTCPGYLLPWLAWTLSLDGSWNLAESDEARRALIKGSIAMHRRKGTPWSVLQALALVGVTAELAEWFEATPDAPPYTFFVDIGLDVQPINSPPMGSDRIAQISRLVNFWKPVRCHFNVRISATSVERWQIAGTHSGFQRLSARGALGAVGDLVRAGARLRTAGLGGGTALLGSYGVARSDSTASSISQIVPAGLFAGTALLVSSSTIQ